MNRLFSPCAASVAAARCHRRAGAFSLVVTLIIISMLAVVAIGFLASMSSERVTADAYGNKTRAEQAAQAGADSAMAILRQAFKDFPDSATVWENHSKNGDADPSGAFDGTHPIARYNEGTSLYLRAMPDGSTGLPDPAADNGPNHTMPSPGPSPGADARTTFVLPLVSGAVYKTLVTKDSAVNNGADFRKGKISDQDNFVDLNVLRYKGDSQGWLGSPPLPTPTPGASPASTPPPKTTRVPWVEIKQADAQDPAKAPVVARYAFWMEDESFRTNVNQGGVGDGTTAVTIRRLDNKASFPITAPTPGGSPGPNQALNASNVDLYASLHLLGDPLAVDRANGITKVRALYPGSLFPEALGFSHAGDGTEFNASERLDSATADRFRFLTTTTSAGLNLSRHGSQRLSLNSLMYPANASTPQKRIDTIIKTIQFHAPNFGQRFYRLATAWPGTAYDSSTLNAMTVTGDPDPMSVLHDHKLIYLNRIAANIVDYMDEDDQPTFIDQTGNVVTGIFQGLQGFDRLNSASPIWANGKESIPYMEECAARFRLKAFSPPDPTRYHLYVDYYIEYWNMTGRDIPPITGAKIRVSQPPPWVGNFPQPQANKPNGDAGNDTWLPCDQSDGISPSQSREFTYSPDHLDRTPRRDFDIDISGVTFKAGRCTVITTDPDWKDVIPNWQAFNENPTSTTENPPNIFVCRFDAPGKRDYTGAVPIARGTTATRCSLIHFPLGPPITLYTSTNSSDYKTSVVTYKPGIGYLDLLEGAMPMSNNSSPFAMTLPAGSTGYKLYGGSLRGNTGTYPALSGDPRTNNEQMDYLLYESGGPVDQSRYFNFTFNANAGSGSDSSLGYPNVNFVKPNENTTSGITPWPDAIMFDSTLKKGVFAPAVIANTRLTSIGQLGDIFDPAHWVTALDQRTLNAARGGGRTLKIGQHDDRWDGDSASASHSWAAWRLTDFFCTDDAMLQPGLINVNGVARDNGAALRAALSGFKFQQNAPNGRGSPNLEAANPLNIDPQPTPTPSGTPSASLDALITQAKKRLVQPPGKGIPGYEPLNTGTGPFFERGEFSELPVFGRNNTTTAAPTGYKANDLSGVDMGSLKSTDWGHEVEDRGREELFRRLVEMITTRGDVFTVYAMGQSISQLPQTDPNNPPIKRITGTQRLKITFRLVPKTADKPTGSSTTSDFHPATDVNGAPKPFDIATRFLKPDHYDIEILSASKGGG